MDAIASDIVATSNFAVLGDRSGFKVVGYDGKVCSNIKCTYSRLVAGGEIIAVQDSLNESGRL